ncbi:MAG: helix-turn-helix domain-containing protein [Clostridia bacterium]|nr:helix-turn-helix domain-containing protein [Clostridia bacterium]
MKQLLNDANITQVELAKKLNVTQSLISQWVRGICEPKIEQLPTIAKILGVSVEKVIDCFKPME